MSNLIKATCEISSGKIKCRYVNNWTQHLITKGEPYFDLEGTVAFGRFRLGICKEHFPAFKQLIDEAAKDFLIGDLNGRLQSNIIPHQKY